MKFSVLLLIGLSTIFTGTQAFAQVMTYNHELHIEGVDGYIDTDYGSGTFIPSYVKTSQGYAYVFSGSVTYDVYRVFGDNYSSSCSFDRVAVEYNKYKFVCTDERVTLLIQIGGNPTDGTTYHITVYDHDVLTLNKIEMTTFTGVLDPTWHEPPVDIKKESFVSMKANGGP